MSAPEFHRGHVAEPAPTGYLVAPDAYDTPAIWRAGEPYCFPTVVITRDALRDDPALWDALVAAVERGRA